ncbi:MAG: hypothetical protein ACOYI9_01925 [Candidatus Hydrogenedentales bacterium]|jgi:hypothetical protein
MNEQNKKQIIMAAVLGVVLVGVLVYQVMFSGPPDTGRSSDKDSTQSAKEKTKSTAAARRASAKAGAAPFPGSGKALELSDIQAMIASVEVKPLDYMKEHIARNPMSPLVGVLRRSGQSEASEEPTEAMSQIRIDTTAAREVSGIIWDSQYPLAIVDDMVVHVGFVFPNGAQVEKIEPTRVFFKVGNTIIPVEMKEY